MEAARTIWMWISRFLPCPTNKHPLEIECGDCVNMIALNATCHIVEILIMLKVLKPPRASLERIFLSLHRSGCIGGRRMARTNVRGSVVPGKKCTEIITMFIRIISHLFDAYLHSEFSHVTVVYVPLCGTYSESPIKCCSIYLCLPSGALQFRSNAIAFVGPSHRICAIWRPYSLSLCIWATYLWAVSHWWPLGFAALLVSWNRYYTLYSAVGCSPTDRSDVDFMQILTILIASVWIS